MKLLLDTHTVLWAATNDTQLSNQARITLLDPVNTLYFSTVSAWEIVIKHATTKLTLPDPPAIFIKTAIARGSYTVLDVSLEHTLGVALLPLLHKDPFDRLLIAQALHEGLTLLSNDAAIAHYSVPMHW